MSAPLPSDPCLEGSRPAAAWPAGGGSASSRSSRPARTAAPRSTCTRSLTRIDPDRYDVSVVALSPGSAVRKLQRAGIPVLVIDEVDDAIAVGALAAHLGEVRADVVHAHMFRAETVATRAVLALAEIGHRRPYLVSTVHSSRVRHESDKDVLRELTPHMDQLIAVSKAIETKIRDEGRDVVPVALIYNGVDLERYDHQEACCTLPEEYGMEPGSQIVGVVARLEPEKGHPTLLEAWPIVLRAVPDAYLLIVGEGSRRDALEAQARELRVAHRVVFTGRRDDVPAVTAALDVAVLPSYREAQGLTILEAMALSRPVVASERRRDPRDDRGRADRPARPAARRRCPGGRDRPAAEGPPAGRHARPRRARPGPRPLLHRADGRRDRSRSTTRAPAWCVPPRSRPRADREVGGVAERLGSIGRRQCHA